MSKRENYKTMGSHVGEYLGIFSSTIAGGITGGVGSAASYIAATKGLSAITTTTIGSFFTGPPGWLAWLALASGTAAGLCAGFKLGSLEEKYIGMGKKGGSVVEATAMVIPVISKKISMNRNKLIFLSSSILMGFLIDRSIFISKTRVFGTILTQSTLKKNTETHYGLYGAGIGFSFALLIIGIYYYADPVGKEIREANKRLTDTISLLMKNVSLKKDQKEGKNHSDLQNFGKMAQFVSEIPGLKIPDQYLCPIGTTIMILPVTAADGHDYEQGTLQRWYDQGKNTCPQDPSKVLENPRLLQINQSLSKAIRLYVEACYEQANNHSSSSTQGYGRPT